MLELCSMPIFVFLQLSEFILYRCKLLYIIELATENMRKCCAMKGDIVINLTFNLFQAICYCEKTEVQFISTKFKEINLCSFHT